MIYLEWGARKEYNSSRATTGFSRVKIVFRFVEESDAQFLQMDFGFYFSAYIKIKPGFVTGKAFLHNLIKAFRCFLASLFQKGEPFYGWGLGFLHI